MTSQINSVERPTVIRETEKRRPLANVPKQYCKKLQSGIARLEAAIRRQYEEAFPAAGELIARALCEAKEAARSTPFPSLFFPALAHLRVQEMTPSV